MIISDLNYLEAVAEETSVLGGIANVNRRANLAFVETIDITKRINSVSNARGNVGFAEGDATATGRNTVAQSITFTDAVEGRSSEASSTSVSAANP